MIDNPPPSLTSPPWSVWTKRTVVLVVLALMFLLSLQLVQVLTLLVIAGILAYLLNPWVDRIDAYFLRHLPVLRSYPQTRRGLSVLLTFILVIALLLLMGVLIAPPLLSQSREFIQELPSFISRYEEQLESWLSQPLRLGNQTYVPWTELQSLVGEQEENGGGLDLVGAIQQGAATLSAPVVNLATIAFNFIFNLLFLLVILFYLLKDGPHFIQEAEKLTPVEYQGDVQRLLYELARIWNAYLRGQLLLGIIVGVETVIAASILGLPQPLVLGLIAGLLEFIPNLGPILATIPAVLFALIAPSTTIPGLEGLPFVLVVILTYAFIQQSEYFILVPRIMGSSLDLHPLAVLLAVLSGAILAGILGLVLAAPVLATLRLFFLYIWAKIMDIDPFRPPSNPVNFKQVVHEGVLSPSYPPALHSPAPPEEHGEIIE